MTPTAGDLLRGIVVTLTTPAAAEDAALFAPGRLGMIALASIIAAQEAERGAAVRVAENAAIRAVLGDAAYPVTDAPPDAGDGDVSIAALDAANAALRRRLIELHLAVEAAGDRTRDRAILALYRRMADGRRLVLPPPAA